MPQSGDGSRIVIGADSGDPFSVENDLPGLSVGELVVNARLLGSGGSPLRVTQRVAAAVPTPSVWPVSDLPLILSDGVVADFPSFFGGPGFEPAVLANVTAEGDVTLTPQTGLMLVNSSVIGRVAVPAGASLAAYDAFIPPIAGPVTLDVADGFAGTLDLSGTIVVGGDATLDLSGGRLLLAGEPHSLSFDVPTQATVAGDVRLGEWILDGWGFDGFGPIFDRLDVTGDLDLTAATIVTRLDGIYDVDLSFSTPDLPPFITLASYGGRLGAFPDSSLNVLATLNAGLDFGTLFDGPAPIVYTSGENAGPGEVRLLLPEPAAAGVALLAAGVLLLRRRLP